MKEKYLGVCVLALGVCLFGDIVANNQNDGNEKAAAGAPSSANEQNSERGQFIITNGQANPGEKMGECTYPNMDKFDIIQTEFFANTCPFSALWQGEESFTSGIESMKRLLSRIGNNLYLPLIRSLILLDISAMKQNALNVMEYNGINEKFRTLEREIKELLPYIPASELDEFLIGAKILKRNELDEYKRVSSSRYLARVLLGELRNEARNDKLTKEKRDYLKKKSSSIEEVLAGLDKESFIKYLNTKVLREAGIMKDDGSEESNITNEQIKKYFRSLAKWNCLSSGASFETNPGMFIAAAYLQDCRLNIFTSSRGAVVPVFEMTTSVIQDCFEPYGLQLDLRKIYGLQVAYKKNPDVLNLNKGLNYTDYGCDNSDDFLIVCSSFLDAVYDVVIDNKKIDGPYIEGAKRYVQDKILPKISPKRCPALEQCGLTLTNVLKVQYVSRTDPVNAPYSDEEFEKYGIDMQALKKVGFDRGKLNTLCFSLTEELESRRYDWMTYIKSVMDGGEERAEWNERYKRYLSSYYEHYLFSEKEVCRLALGLMRVCTGYRRYIEQNPLSDEEVNRAFDADMQRLSDIYILYNGLNHFMKLIPSAQNQNGQTSNRGNQAQSQNSQPLSQSSQIQGQGDQVKDQGNQTQNHDSQPLSQSSQIQGQGDQVKDQGNQTQNHDIQ